MPGEVSSSERPSVTAVSPGIGPIRAVDMRSGISARLPAFPQLISPARTWVRVSAVPWLAAEWVAIVAWGLWVGRAYLNTNPYLWPNGYGLGTQKLVGHQFWVDLQHCGLCALWNGSLNGGHPALADLFGSQFHPLIGIPTLIWGVIVGVKVAQVGIVILAGLAQWWIARVLGLGRAARVWSALLAAAGGHLATQQWEGNFGLSLSMASAGLVTAASIALAQAPRRRNTVILAVMATLLMISGQGYIQTAFLAWAPGLLFFLFNQARERTQSVIREFTLAVGLSALLAAFVLVPVAHFWPNFTKDTAHDPTYAYAQPLEYVPLNFLIRDGAYFHMGGILGKVATADLPYIGWVPLLLAWLSLRFARRPDVPALGFLATGAVITMLLTAGIPLRTLAAWSPYFLWFKNIQVFIGLAVPPLLGLAAFGLDRLLRSHWPRLELALESNRADRWFFNTRWLLVLPLVASLLAAANFTERYMVPQDQTQMYTEYIAHYQTPSTQWIAPPFGEPVWTQPALDRGFKVTYQEFSGSRWSGRELPAPHLISVRGELASEKPFEQVGLIDGALPVYRIPSNEYAFVTHADGQTSPCAAQARGGFIRVHCATDREGVLTVMENEWQGWRAWQDGRPIAVQAQVGELTRWLGAYAPAGDHTFDFKYLPWDALVGAVMTLVGAGLAVNWWQGNRPGARRDTLSGGQLT